MNSSLSRKVVLTMFDWNPHWPALSELHQSAARLKFCPAHARSKRTYGLENARSKRKTLFHATVGVVKSRHHLKEISKALLYLPVSSEMRGAPSTTKLPIQVLCFNNM